MKRIICCLCLFYVTYTIAKELDSSAVKSGLNFAKLVLIRSIWEEEICNFRRVHSRGSKVHSVLLRDTPE